MQAIITKFIAPTNHRGSRVVAKAATKKIVVSWDHYKGVPGNHKAAAMTLAQKLGWEGRWVAGGMPDDNGYVFVNDDWATRACDTFNIIAD